MTPNVEAEHAGDGNSATIQDVSTMSQVASKDNSAVSAHETLPVKNDKTTKAPSLKAQAKKNSKQARAKHPTETEASSKSTIPSTQEIPYPLRSDSAASIDRVHSKEAPDVSIASTQLDDDVVQPQGVLRANAHSNKQSESPLQAVGPNAESQKSIPDKSPLEHSPPVVGDNIQPAPNRPKAGHPGTSVSQGTDGAEKDAPSDDDQKHDNSFHSAKETQSEAERELPAASESSSTRTIKPEETSSAMIKASDKKSPERPQALVKRSPTPEKKAGAKQTESIFPFAKTKAQKIAEKSARKKKKKANKNKDASSLGNPTGGSTVPLSSDGPECPPGKPQGIAEVEEDESTGGKQFIPQPGQVTTEQVVDKSKAGSSVQMAASPPGMVGSDAMSFEKGHVGMKMPQPIPQSLPDSDPKSNREKKAPSNRVAVPNLKFISSPSPTQPAFYTPLQTPTAISGLGGELVSAAVVESVNSDGPTGLSKKAKKKNKNGKAPASIDSTIPSDAAKAIPDEGESAFSEQMKLVE